ncbi:MAG: class E sortase [Acidimicrobiales bacterium]
MFVATGLLLLSFVAYQLWGTALYEHSAQNHLRHELQGKLPTPPISIPASTIPGSPTTTPPAEVVSHVAPPTADPNVGAPLGLISIPRLGMSNTVIVEGTGENQLQQGPGHYVGTPLPGEAGNVGIAGHRTTYGAPFYDLNELQPGDQITIQTAQGLFDYQVATSHVVSPADTAVLEASTVPELTLTTCNPRYSAATRLVVVATLKTAITPASFVGTSSTSTSTTTVTTPAHVALPTTLAGGDEGLGGVTTSGQVRDAVIWGALTLLAAALGVVAWRRGRRPWSWVAFGMGVPLVLGALLMCFQHVSLALPQSF